MKNDMTNDEKMHTELGKKILSVVPQLHPYVKHRLYTVETSGIVPKNMYRINGIIDDAILKFYELYEKPGEVAMGQQEIKLKLFKLVNERFDELRENESWHLDTLSTSEILSKELDLLEEKFKLGLHEDLVMDEELDDISYHQNDSHKEKFLYDDAEHNIIKSLDILDPRIEINNDKRKKLNKIYMWLPAETSGIVDMYVFGKLTYDEISIIKDIKTDKVKNIVTMVRKSFRKNID